MPPAGPPAPPASSCAATTRPRPQGAAVQLVEPPHPLRAGNAGRLRDPRDARRARLGLVLPLRAEAGRPGEIARILDGDVVDEMPAIAPEREALDEVLARTRRHTEPDAFSCGRKPTVSTTSVRSSQRPIEWPWRVGWRPGGCAATSRCTIRLAPSRSISNCHQTRALQPHSVYHGRAAAAITLMAKTIQLIAASPMARERRVILRRIAAIPSRAARCPAGIEVA